MLQAINWMSMLYLALKKCKCTSSDGSNSYFIHLQIPCGMSKDLLGANIPLKRIAEDDHERYID